MSSRGIVRFHTVRDLMLGVGPEPRTFSRDRKRLTPRVAVYLRMIGTLTVSQVAYTLGVTATHARRSLEALCDAGQAARNDDGSYGAVGKQEASS